ncbi:MAG: hypothetical protein HC763_29660, partial [Hydrococcus sp. CRU_1_1]|nr:hypothetical protein [Hydrococcus sp. CRU_1_1]
IENLLLSDYPVTDETVFLLAQARFTIEEMEIMGDIRHLRNSNILW